MEHWDLYDAERKPLGRTHLRGEKFEEGEFYVCCEVWVMNSKGEFLTTQRHPAKKAGGQWEFVGGGTLAGETTAESAVRELFEETGIVTLESELKKIATYAHKNYFQDIYLLKKDVEIGDLVLCPDETVSAKWANGEEIRGMIEAGEFVYSVGLRFGMYGDLVRRTERFAVLSDVHGNHPALVKVLEDAKSRGIDQLIIAGDYCLSGAWPNDCIETLKGISKKRIIRGNEERYLENLIGKDQSTWTDGQMQISYWNYRNIEKENLDYILALPHTVEFECNGVKIHVAHSSDAFIGEYEFAHFGPGIIAKKYENIQATKVIVNKDIQNILNADADFHERMASLEEGVYVFGHSHVQWAYKDSPKGILLINPGSCGLPLDAIKNSLPYTILTITEDGDVSVEEIRVPFTMADYVEEIRKTTQYAEAHIWSEVIFKELLTAREHLMFFLQFADQYALEIGDEKRPFTVETWEKAYDEWSKRENGN